MEGADRDSGAGLPGVHFAVSGVDGVSDQTCKMKGPDRFRRCNGSGCRRAVVGQQATIKSRPKLKCQRLSSPSGCVSSEVTVAGDRNAGWWNQKGKPFAPYAR